MLYLWTGEIAMNCRVSRGGHREKGNFQISANMAKHYPAVFHLRLFDERQRKVYSADRTYQLTQ